MRTTSSLESMNAALKKMFPAHPHLFKFMDRLQYHEFGRQLLMDELSQNNFMEEPQLKTTIAQDRDAKIKGFLDKLLDKEVMFNTSDFLKSVSIKSIVPDIGENILLDKI